MPHCSESPRGTGYRETTNDLAALLCCLPTHVQQAVGKESGLDELLEIVLDLGRLPEARFASRAADLGAREVTAADLQHVVDRVSPFGGDNRAGIERTLHRISAIRNRSSQVVGITCRVGRAVFGTVQVVDDLVRSGRNILLVGRPGVGKTTMLREVARVLSESARLRVVIVDTSNEIAGDGDVPHQAIGRARRMQVATPARQHAVMIEAVENHMPEVIIIDEMGTEQEAQAARTIAERGVQLIATAHGNTLQNLLINPTLSDLVGGVQSVTLGDQEARRRRTQKVILERKAPPTFDVLVEIQNWAQVAVHEDVALTVDRILRGEPVSPELRWLDPKGRVLHSQEPQGESPPPRDEDYSSSEFPGVTSRSPALVSHYNRPLATPLSTGRALLIFPYGVSRGQLDQAASDTGLPVRAVDDVRDAELVLTTRSQFRRRSILLRGAEQAGKPVLVLRKNTLPQLRTFLLQVCRQAASPASADDHEESQGPEQRVAHAISGRPPVVALRPQGTHVRRLQHYIEERGKPGPNGGPWRGI